jgi:hypothetical protein
MIKNVGFERGQKVEKHTISRLFLAVLGRKSAKKREAFNSLDAVTDEKKMQVLRLTTPN